MREPESGWMLGAGLIVLGLYLLALALGVPLPGWVAIWPVFPLAGGLGNLIQALRKDPRDAGGVWFGITATLSSLLFLHITVGSGQWSDMRTLWPLFLAAAGAGWLAAWTVQREAIANLVMALVAGVAAVLGYAFVVGRLGPEQGQDILNWWPLILVLLGLSYILQSLLQKR